MSSDSSAAATGTCFVVMGFGKKTDFETGREFTANSTIQVFEPKVQLVANAALTLVAIWASYRVMWGHGLRSQFTARILLPRLMMSAVLINFALPLVQALVQASNAACDAVRGFGMLPDWEKFLENQERLRRNRSTRRCHWRQRPIAPSRAV